MDQEFYVGIYESDDSKSRKECRTVLVFGEPVKHDHYKTSSYYDWKHVELPCPVCMFTHNFKRCEWQYPKLNTMGDYTKE